MDRRISLVINVLENYISCISRQDSGYKRGTFKSIEDPTLKELALSVNLSETRLRALFKAETGMTPAKYLKRLKMKEAFRLVQSTHLKIIEIMAILRVSDPSHFMRELKLEFRISLTEYRKQLQSNDTQLNWPMNSRNGQ